MSSNQSKIEFAKCSDIVDDNDDCKYVTAFVVPFSTRVVENTPLGVLNDCRI